jgi:hypothetical protein
MLAAKKIFNITTQYVKIGDLKKEHNIVVITSPLSSLDKRFFSDLSEKYRATAVFFPNVDIETYPDEIYENKLQDGYFRRYVVKKRVKDSSYLNLLEEAFDVYCKDISLIGKMLRHNFSKPLNYTGVDISLRDVTEIDIFRLQTAHYNLWLEKRLSKLEKQIIETDAYISDIQTHLLGKEKELAEIEPGLKE